MTQTYSKSLENEINQNEKKFIDQIFMNQAINDNEPMNHSKLK